MWCLADPNDGNMACPKLWHQSCVMGTTFSSFHGEEERKRMTEQPYMGQFCNLFNSYDFYFISLGNCSLMKTNIIYYQYENGRILTC